MYTLMYTLHAAMLYVLEEETYVLWEISRF